MSSNTALALPSDIPAYIRDAAAKNAELNRSALGGIKAGSFPRISIGGSKFSIVEGGEKVLIADADKPDLPAMELQVVVVGFNPFVSKLYFEGDFKEGDDKEPTCSADNGVTPDPHIQRPQASACATCPKNIWGSKITPQGKQVKACSDNKRLVVVLAHDIANEQALDLTIKPASLKTWAEYVRALDSKGISVDNVVTKVQFDPSANFPKLVFKFGRFLTEAEIIAAQARSKGDDVRLITMPRSTTATGPAPTAKAPEAPVAPDAATTPAPAPQAAPAPVAPKIIPVAPAPQAPAAPAPTPAAPVQPVLAPVAVDIYAGQPPHVKAAVDGAGGPDSPAGQQVYKALTGKSVAEQPAPKPVDPFEGQPPHVKLAVDAAGGIDSEPGKATYKALTGKDASGVVAAPKRGRPAKAVTPPTPAAPATPTAPAPAPAPSAAPAAAAPVAGAGLGSDLDALLSQAMNTPTAK
jgi:hypothetical protein